MTEVCSPDLVLGVARAAMKRRSVVVTLEANEYVPEVSWYLSLTCYRDRRVTSNQLPQAPDADSDFSTTEAPLHQDEQNRIASAPKPCSAVMPHENTKTKTLTHNPKPQTQNPMCEILYVSFVQAALRPAARGFS